jgi:IS5 family transposase
VLTGGVKQNTDGNKIAWFGYKVHIATDTKSELPIAVAVTPASIHDSNMALDIIKQVEENVITHPRYYLMDSGYDSADIYTAVGYDHHAQAVIPLNLRGAKEPKAGFDFDGTPICSAGLKMVYWGHDKDVNKFRCPHILGKSACAYGSAWCSESNYGMVIKTRVKDDPRLFCTPIGELRTGVERSFGRLKEHLGLDPSTLRGMAKVKPHAYLCAISLLATVIAVNSVKKEQIAA